MRLLTQIEHRGTTSNIAKGHPSNIAKVHSKHRGRAFCKHRGCAFNEHRGGAFFEYCEEASYEHHEGGSFYTDGVTIRTHEAVMSSGRCVVATIRTAASGIIHDVAKGHAPWHMPTPVLTREIMQPCMAKSLRRFHSDMKGIGS